jgi:peptide methionine sulfoxide reductase msrA/msrB
MATCGLPKSDLELRRILSPEQYRIVRENGTEQPFHNAYWDAKSPGIYVDAVSGEPLFGSRDKFDSGSGWPSFTAPVRPDALVYKQDRSHGMVRTEVRSRSADSHLGHLFKDGPPPNLHRFCINSASLRFVPAEELEKEGLGDFSAAASASVEGRPGGESGPEGGAALETAVFAGGCFWGVEAYFDLLAGVVDSRVGYTGGLTEKPNYKQVCSGTTNHAEAVKILYDPRIITYRELLERFFSIHDPTSLNRQGNDLGTQYRSAVYFTSPAQEAAARDFIREAGESGKYRGRTIVTEVRGAENFWDAEEYHQKYLEKNPGGYCHVRLDRVYG